MRVRHPRGDASHEGLEPPNVRRPVVRELAGERGSEVLELEASKLEMRRRVSGVCDVCVFARVGRVHHRVVHVSGDERLEVFAAVPREGARYRLGDE